MNQPGKAVAAPEGQSETLEQLGLSTGHAAIVGLQWGDEGKGKVVDLLAAGFDYVVRYNGGANAGHSVQVGDERYALHLIPSGILYPEKVNVLGNGVVIDPEQLLKEIHELSERGVRIGDNLRISDRAHVVLPYHKRQDVLYDQAVARQWQSSGPIGTTGRGIGPCYADKALRSTAVRVGDLLDERRLRELLVRIVAIKNTMLHALAQQCGETDFEGFDPEEVVDQAAAWGRALAPYVCDGAELLHGAMERGQRLLFEGANAALLDIDHGTYPYVTSSNCSALGVSPGTGVPAQQVPHVLGIAKAYQTRVGGGPMPTELDDAVGEQIRRQGNEYGTTTGRPRRCGWLDLVALRYTARISGATGIALMLLDVLSGLETVKLCTGYEYQGEILKHMPANADVLEQVRPVYEALAGFTGSVEDCRRWADLPDAAQRYVERIEQEVGVPVVMLSVGPRRDQTILREPGA